MRIMRCKLKLNSCQVLQTNDQGQITAVKVQFGAVYEPDDKKRTDPASENSIFGKYTPHGSFEASIYNEEVARTLVTMFGKEFYFDTLLAGHLDPVQ